MYYYVNSRLPVDASRGATVPILTPCSDFLIGRGAWAAAGRRSPCDLHQRAACIREHAAS